MQEKDDTTHVYVIAKKDKDNKVWGPCKIGISARPDLRLATIQTATPFKIELVWFFQLPTRRIAASIERCFHDTQKKRHAHGEWFDIEPIQAIQLLCLAIRTHVEQFVDCKEDIPAILDCAGVAWAEKRFGFRVPGATIQ